MIGPYNSERRSANKSTRAVRDLSRVEVRSRSPCDGGWTVGRLLVVRVNASLSGDPRSADRGQAALVQRGAARAGSDEQPGAVRDRLGPLAHLAEHRPGADSSGTSRTESPRSTARTPRSDCRTAGAMSSARTHPGPTRKSTGTSRPPAAVTSAGRTACGCSPPLTTTVRSASNGRTPAWTGYTAADPEALAYTRSNSSAHRPQRRVRRPDITQSIAPKPRPGRTLTAPTQAGTTL